MVLFELSMIIFIVWLLGLIIYKICFIIITKNNNNNKVISEVGFTNSEEIKGNGNNDSIEDGTIVNLYEEPEMPKTIEELRKERVLENLTKKFDDNQSMIDGLFTVEEYKELSKLLHDMKKNKKA